ncbi:MAG: phosphopentomutase [Oscillospiraceae bacterium]|nr:phosphopentomutase [Oscillospiraceae bacterium]
MKKRVFLIVLDSFGIGNMPDAAKFGDEGSDTLLSISRSEKFSIPNMAELGMFNIDDVTCGEKAAFPKGSFARIREASNGKDTTIGHWEIAGVESARPLPVYPDGFPDDVIEKYKQLTGKNVVCNKPYSGTEVIAKYGKEHLETGDLIVYTSADSVFQVAAHEDIVPVEKLYEYCQIARDMLVGEHAVGRVIARPFVTDENGVFKRTINRHDYSLKPPKKTVLDYIKAAGKDVIGVGKIYDIFDGEGITEKIKTGTNDIGVAETYKLLDRDFDGLAFVNLVDFDSVYGHRNDVDGYANAATEFDSWLGTFIPRMRDEDMLIITADHGCDPGTPSTDHSRECVPLLIYGKNIKENNNLGTITSFAHIGATVADYLGVAYEADAPSLLDKILK